MQSDHLFSPFAVRGVTLPNRIVVSPMCEYSSEDGFANDWHLVHLGSRAAGGAGLIIVEASAVVPEGRITPADLGIWKDDHIEKLQQIVSFAHSQGARIGMQLAHAGRKASMARPWDTEQLVPVEQGGWSNVMAPSAIAFAPNYATPKALDRDGIRRVVRAFADAARRSVAAGFDLVEIHAAHGYLLHEFLSPISNHRHDEYGGSFENRTRLLLEAVAAVRGVVPDSMPIFVRISATDWVERGWNLDESTLLAAKLAAAGVDLVDVSSGGMVPNAAIPVGPGFQTPFAAHIRAQAGVATGTVGMITGAAQADHILRTGQADLVLLARELLRDPYWPLHAAEELGRPAPWPVQYLRAAPRGSTAREPLAEPLCYA